MWPVGGHRLCQVFDGTFKVFIIDEVPLTGAKKVDRTRLKELARK